MRKQEKSGKRTSTVAAVVLGVFIMTMALPAHAVLPSVSILGTSVSGANVNVTVKNNTILPQVRTVTVTAVVNGSSRTSSALVTLLPYQTVSVSASFSLAVSVVGSVGLSDGDTPF